MTPAKCPHCHGELVEKSRSGLLFVATVFLGGAIAVFLLYAIFWIAALLLLVIAIFLFAWSVLGKGRWCRSCRKFPMLRRSSEI